MLSSTDPNRDPYDGDIKRIGAGELPRPRAGPEYAAAFGDPVR
jgi:hypothetical protein